MKNSMIFVGIFILTMALIGFSQAKGKGTSVEKSFSVSSGGTFILDTDNGSVEVESHDRDMVEILVERKGRNSDDLEIEYSQDGNNVKVTGDRSKLSFFGGSNVNFVVKVPSQYNLDLRTSGGSISVSSLVGQVDAYTSGGSIRLGKIKGNVEVKTSGGSIKVEEVDGNINAHTSGGSVKATFASQPTENSRLTTSGGSVTAYLLPSISVDLYASTSGGRVSSDFNVRGVTKKTKIDGEINGGGPKLTLKTSGGSVRIKQL